MGRVDVLLPRNDWPFRATWLRHLYFVEFRYRLPGHLGAECKVGRNLDPFGLFRFGLDYSPYPF